MNNYDAFINDAKELNIDITDDMICKFDKFYNMLVETNKVMNLTAITDFDEVCKLHFIDSLSSYKYFDFQDNDFSIIDIGTGAGFPGIPLKIVFPHLHITLFDSLNKRIKFLNDVIEELNLNSVGSINTIHGRAEDFCSPSKDSLREKYDIAVSRAVANISTLSEYCLPYVKVGGCFISYKGDNFMDELGKDNKALKILGGKLKTVESFLLPNSDIHRNICIIDKKVNTPKTYPRKAGTPSKSPL
ncbi:MAG: 16S rRNA (guanine(527)-N(7))-methyltransferase RsmG [Butyrivibrio sp.]|nr:16S rRNA (guanine(527)-N(7))-methyltransferase RsmG [Butyrivibrio sp.]